MGYGAIWDPTRNFPLIRKAIAEPPVRYEYRCPWCNHINVRYARTGRKVCDTCGRGFG